MRPDAPVEGSRKAQPTTWSAIEIPSSAAVLEAEGYAPELAQLLAMRGADTPAAAHAFLEPTVDQLHSPSLLAGMDEAVERLVSALRADQKVAIVGDYDVDGVSGTALLVAALGACGLATVPIVPHRMKEGYGFQLAHVERAAAGGCELILTVDCGTTATAAITAAAERKIDVIVVDHHLPADDFPTSAIQINPQQASCSYPFRQLAAAGLAFKLAAALLERVKRKTPVAALLRVACLGTIADVVPLVGENRVIASLGLRALAASKSPGLRALLSISGVKPPLRAEDIGFRIGPRINAAGRLDSAEPALRLLLTRDEHEADSLAQELDQWNQRRQGEERKVVDEAFEIFDSEAELPNLLMAWSADWHKGVVGIAAGRLARHYHRPAILLGVEGESSTGSGRSIEGLHLHDFLGAWRAEMERFGGHAQAIGLTVATSRLEELREQWLDAARWPDDLLRRHYRYELALEGARPFDLALYRQLIRLEPFGAENPAPLLRVGPLRLLTEPRPFGVGHLKAIAKGPEGGRVTLLGWRWQRRVDDLKGTFEVLAHADWDDYLGTPILRLVDARPAEWNSRASG